MKLDFEIPDDTPLAKALTEVAKAGGGTPTQIVGLWFISMFPAARVRSLSSKITRQELMEAQRVWKEAAPADKRAALATFTATRDALQAKEKAISVAIDAAVDVATIL